jgi:hypothetical protein
LLPEEYKKVIGNKFVDPVRRSIRGSQCQSILMSARHDKIYDSLVFGKAFDAFAEYAPFKSLVRQQLSRNGDTTKKWMSRERLLDTAEKCCEFALNSLEEIAGKCRNLN